jgi:hypothetical protein
MDQATDKTDYNVRVVFDAAIRKKSPPKPDVWGPLGF